MNLLLLSSSLAVNALVFRYSSIPGLAYLRIVFWLALPLLLIGVKLLSLKHERLGLLLIALTGMAALRLLQGPFIAHCNPEPESSALLESVPLVTSNVHVVVFTEPASTRGDFVAAWLRQYTSFPSLEINMDSPLVDTYKKELEYTWECEHALARKRVITYTYRMRRYLEKHARMAEEDGGWILLLENDAEAVHPTWFQTRVEALARRYSGEVDVIWLDYRNVFSDLTKQYSGTAGMLFRRSSLSSIAGELKYDADKCRRLELPMAWDNILAQACARGGKLRCVTKVLVAEHGFASTLDWNREERFGAQQVTWWEYLLTNFACLLLARAATV